MTRLRRTLRLGTVGLVLALAAFLVPDSAVKSTETTLVRVNSASGVDVTPDVIWILAVGSDAARGRT